MPDIVDENAKKADEMIRQMAAARAEAPAPDGFIEIKLEEPAPVPTPAPTPEPESKPEPVPESDVSQLRAEVARLTNEYGLEHQRYKSLQGMITQRDQTIAQLNQILASMQAAPPAPEPVDYLSEEDDEKFGSDLVNMSTRAAQHVFAQREKEMASTIAALRDELSQIKSQVGGVQQETYQTKFANFCTQVAAVVDEKTGGRFKEINEAPEFASWITRSPAMTTLFDTARQQMDLNGVLTVYEMYAKTLLTGKQESSPPTQTPSMDPRLARQVDPGKSRSTPSPAEKSEGAKRQWTRTGIVDFYNKKTTYPRETADALERDIFLAQKEGRVDFAR